MKMFSLDRSMIILSLSEHFLVTVNSLDCQRFGVFEGSTAFFSRASFTYCSRTGENCWGSLRCRGGFLIQDQETPLDGIEWKLDVFHFLENFRRRPPT